MNFAVRMESQETLADLVHDLRQPLSALEYSASYLQILLGEAEGPAQKQLGVMHRQIELAARLLDHAAERVARPRFSVWRRATVWISRNRKSPRSHIQAA